MGRARARGRTVWVGTREAARILGWSEGRVRNHRKDLGGRKVNNVLKYRRSKVEALATPRPRPARPTLEPTARLEPAPQESVAAGFWGPLAGLAVATVACIAGVVWIIGWLLGGEPDPVVPAPSPPAVVQWTASPDTPYVQGVRPHAVCRDGTVSYAISNRGTCSWHGGVAYWAYDEPGR